VANTLIADSKIEAEVRSTLAATLRLEPDGIGLHQSIIKNLGATSIDFLDANFRLEATFGIQLATQLILDHVEEEFGDGTAIDNKDRITGPAAALLRTHLGEIEGLVGGLDAENVPALVTPWVLVRSVRVIVDSLPDQCTHCSQSDWASEDGAKVQCGSCGKPAEYVDGDALTKQWIHEFENEHHVFADA
jgi:acyl carrier protein